MDHSNKQKFLPYFCDDLINIGVRKDGVLLVHSALSSIGQVPDGAETIIQGLLTVIGKKGTLLMADNVIDRSEEYAEFLHYFLENGINHTIIQTECGLLVGKL